MVFYLSSASPRPGGDPRVSTRVVRKVALTAAAIVKRELTAAAIRRTGGASVAHFFRTTCQTRSGRLPRCGCTRPEEVPSDCGRAGRPQELPPALLSTSGLFASLNGPRRGLAAGPGWCIESFGKPSASITPHLRHFPSGPGRASWLGLWSVQRYFLVYTKTVYWNPSCRRPAGSM